MASTGPTVLDLVAALDASGQKVSPSYPLLEPMYSYILFTIIFEFAEYNLYIVGTLVHFSFAIAGFSRVE